MFLKAYRETKLFFPISGMIIFVALLFAGSDYRSTQEQQRLTTDAEVSRVELALSRRLQYISQDVVFLANSSRMLAVLRDHDARAVTALAYDWTRFSDIKQVYDQIRWIDETGMERIRVNRHDRGAYLVPATELQNKKGRYYFDETIQLEQGQLSVSPLDLNVEQGMIEQPRKPIIRIGTPIFDDGGTKRGILIINYCANNLLDLLKQGNKNIWLVNQEGFWLKGDRPEDEWGFMYDKPNLSVAKRFPDAWEKIRNTPSGNFIDTSALWSFTTITPVSTAPSAGETSAVPALASPYVWKLIRFEPQSRLWQPILDLLPRYLGVTLTLLLITFFATRHMSRGQAAKKRAFEQLRKTQFALDQAGVGIHWVDAQTGKLLYVNEFAATMLGYNVDEMLALSIYDVVPDFPEEAFEAMTVRTFAHGKAHFETVHKRKDGECIPIEVVGYKMPSSADQSSSLITFLTDISTRKATERLMIEARTSAESANVAKSAFLANMSHEIRTPLNAITGMVHMLRRKGVTAEQENRLAKIENAGNHLLEIINDILDLSKIESGKLSLAEEPVCLEELIENVSSMVHPRIKAKQLSFQVDTEALPEPLVGDPTRIRQALLNYLSNAIKFTEHGSIRLQTTVVDDTPGSAKIRFEVSDTGPGIAQEALARLFSPFEQADNSITRKYGGTGLGLAITRRIAELMGGEAGASSEVGKGSRFWLTVRLQKGIRTDELLPPQALSDAEAILKRDHAGTRILLVEDEPINQEITLSLLEDAGLVADLAEDGEQALKQVEDKEYALILMDMQMPKLNGLEATRRIRRQSSGRHIPILAMTANAFTEDKARCFEAGMDDFIAKPVVPETLFRTLLHWLQKNSTKQA